jgi:hypothetical protein
MNIHVNVLKKSVKLLLNQLKKLLMKQNHINNNFLLMLIHVQLVNYFVIFSNGFEWFFVYLELENDFKRKLQEHIAKLDAEKAAVLAQLEKELNVRQELILESARKRIDDLNEEANRLKLVHLKTILISSNSLSFIF